MEQFKLQVNKLTSYSLIFDSSNCILVVLNNTNEMCQQNYGRDFYEML